MTNRISTLRVVVSARDPRLGFLVAGMASFPCAIGRGGGASRDET